MQIEDLIVKEALTTFWKIRPGGGSVGRFLLPLPGLVFDLSHAPKP